MPSGLNKILWSVAVFTCFVCKSRSAPSDHVNSDRFRSVAKIYGSAYTMDGKLIYSETSSFTWHDKKLVQLKTDYEMNGKVFAHLTADFGEHSLLPTTVFLDDRDGSGFEIRKVEGKIEARRRASREAAWEIQKLDLHEDSATSAGIVAYFFQHADELEFLREKQVHYVVPSRLDDYRVELTLEKDSPESMQFSVHLKNPFLRVFASSIQVLVKKNGPEFAEFDGPTNVTIDDGDNKKLHVVYRFEREPETRTPAVADK